MKRSGWTHWTIGGARARTPAPPWRPADLRARMRLPEAMDDPRLDARAHRQALAGLGRLNAASAGDRIVRELAGREIRRARRPLRILEVACGRGDAIAAIARRWGARARCAGEDISPRAIDEARRRHAGSGAEFRVADALAAPPRPRADVVFCSLFAHHLDAGGLDRLLRAMGASARRLAVVADLERGWAAWWGVAAAARLLACGPVVRVDADLSVRAAWTRGELLAAAHRAGIRRARWRAQFPCRQVLLWRPGAP